MILIADSGSTKTEWALVSNNQIIAQLYTQGINPYFQSEVQIATIINDELIPKLPLDAVASIKHIFYYGAGCSSIAKCDIVQQPLHKIFKLASISVNHDLLAAARAACGNKPGIAIILGTGSNSCLFDGKNILSNQPSLGFILGDEGSGGYIGKELLKQFLYGELTPELALLFLKHYTVTKDIVLDNIYKQPLPNRYAASFVPFVANHIGEEQMQQLVKNSFNVFFKRHISSYPNYTSYSLSAVGSVAFVFKKILLEVAAKYSLSVDTVIQNPMEGLLNYHKQ